MSNKLREALDQINEICERKGVNLTNKYYEIESITKAALKEDGWVDVNDRLPKKNEEYIVCGIGFEGKKIVSTLEWKKGKWFSDVYQKYVDQIKITHWQPLPSPPTRK